MIFIHQDKTERTGLTTNNNYNKNIIMNFKKKLPKCIIKIVHYVEKNS